MEKRFILFIALMIGVFFAYIGLDLLIRRWQGPPPAQNVAQNDADGEDAADEDGAGDNDTDDGGDADAGGDAGRGADDSETDAGASPGADGGVEKPVPPDGDEPPKDAEQPKEPQQLGLDKTVWIAVGSLDPESEFSGLYIFKSRGAALERVELNDAKFTDLDGDVGYFGHLALTNEEGGGCRVNVVGDKTPADLAGIRAGDVIVAFQGKETATVGALNRELRETHPKQKVKMTVQRRETPNGPVAKQDVEVTLIRRPLEVIRPEPMDRDNIQPLDVDLSGDPLSLLLTLGGNVKVKNAKGQSRNQFKVIERLRYANWKVEVDKDDPAGPVVEFSLGEEEGLTADVLAEIGISGKLRIVKRFRIAKTPDTEKAREKYGGHKAHHATVEIELINEGDEPIKNVQYVFDGPNGLPTEGWWYSYKVSPAMFATAGARDVIYQTQPMSEATLDRYDFVRCYSIWEQADANKSAMVKFVPADASDVRTVHYAGVDSQYFSAVLIPGTLQERGEVFNRLEMAAVDMDRLPNKYYEKLTNTSFALTSRTFDIPPGETHIDRYTIFAGPKQPDLIESYQLEGFIYYGWFWYVSGPLTWLLHFFESHLVFNYGLAIILLTVLVRGCMFPISRKAVRNAQMMSALAPEMKELAEKYKDDMEKRGKAQRELFAKYNYNPFGGCLLMFLQLPIFLGLYRALCVDIELRGAPLIPGVSWCSNLAAPDMLFYWEPLWSTFTSTIGYLGPYFNLLPLFTVALFVVQQKMFTPPPTDETQKMQQNMMMFMTLFIGIMFFKVPAGLCVYFITSSLWGVAERKLFPKPKLPPELEKKLAEAKKQKESGESGTAAPKSSKTGSNGAAERAWRKKEKGRK